MDHVAIFKKDWGLLEKVLLGKKTIESRWYNSKRIPWGRIKVGDNLYFKNSGEGICVKAIVTRVLEFDSLNTSKVEKILLKYYRKLGITDRGVPYFYEKFKYKKYCILIFFNNIKKLKKCFSINKKRYGIFSAWISVNDIKNIKL